MATNYSDWYADVLPECPGLLADMALFHIRDTCIDFCGRTWAWQYDTAGVMTPSTAVYTLGNPANSVIIAVVSAHGAPSVGATKRPLVHSGEDALKYAPAESGAPSRYSVVSREQVRLYPTPDAGYAYTVRVALEPTRTSTAVADDVLYTHHRYTIGQGALARLKRMSGKPWSDPSGAMVCAAEYARGVRDAKIALNREFASEHLVVDLASRPF